jgi:hypothetical protein
MNELLLQSQQTNRTSSRVTKSQEHAVAGAAHDLTLAEAEDLLDWLEQRQVPAGDIAFSPNCRVNVRWGK